MRVEAELREYVPQRETALTVGVVTSARGDVAEMNLKIPVVAEAGQRVAISRRIGGKWRLIGHGVAK